MLWLKHLFLPCQSFPFESARGKSPLLLILIKTLEQSQARESVTGAPDHDVSLSAALHNLCHQAPQTAPPFLTGAVHRTGLPPGQVMTTTSVLNINQCIFLWSTWRTQKKYREEKSKSPIITSLSDMLCVAFGCNFLKSV
jgi:hypothetical protein